MSFYQIHQKNIHVKKSNVSCGRLQIRDNTKSIKKPHYKSLLKIGIQIEHYHNKNIKVKNEETFLSFSFLEKLLKFPVEGNMGDFIFISKLRNPIYQIFV